MGYSDWLHWLLHGDVAKFYGDQRWPGWEKDVEETPGDRAASIYPFPCFKGPPFGERSRRAVPVEELWSLYVEDLPRQLAEGAGVDQADPRSD